MPEPPDVSQAPVLPASLPTEVCAFQRCDEPAIPERLYLGTFIPLGAPICAKHSQFITHKYLGHVHPPYED